MQRGAPLVYSALLLAMILIGCSTKEDPAEELILCGNHTCGDLVMVTTDTSSDGFRYLNPSLSPDGSTILFTADWQALFPPLPFGQQYPDPLPENRVLVTIPAVQNLQPVTSIGELGAELIYFSSTTITIAGELRSFSPDSWSPLPPLQKGDPIWLGDQNIVCWIATVRGNRLFKADISSLPAEPIILFQEPDDFELNGGFWQQVKPALSPDGQWLAFTRNRCQDSGDPLSCDKQAIYIMPMADPPEGQQRQLYQLVSEAAICSDAFWSSDGRRVVFHATQDLIGISAFESIEIFTVAFDTTGLADSGELTLDNDLQRITFTESAPGDPNIISNTHPVFIESDRYILFVSTRRAPAITLRDRNIWRVPADGQLDPELYFFTRQDEFDPYVYPGGDGTLLVSSSMGFPSEMLDRLEQEARVRIAADPENADWTQTEIEQAAAAERRELEFFERVMTHLFLYRP